MNTLTIAVAVVGLALVADIDHVWQEWRDGLTSYLVELVGIWRTPVWLPWFLTIGAFLLSATWPVLGLLLLLNGRYESALAFVAGGSAMMADRLFTHTLPKTLTGEISPGDRRAWLQVGSALVLIGFGVYLRDWTPSACQGVDYIDLLMITVAETAFLFLFPPLWLIMIALRWKEHGTWLPTFTTEAKWAIISQKLKIPPANEKW